VYPSDTTDAQWAVLEPQARQVMAELVKASGRPVEHNLRRHVAVDVEGWLLSIVVTAASISDRAGARLPVPKLLQAFTTLRLMWADSGYDGAPFAQWAHKTAGITLQIIKRNDPHRFQVVHRRWVVERTFGWLMRYRRLARDYERRTAHHEAMVHWATITIMTRRLARYRTGTPPQPRWGGDRKARPDTQAQTA